MASGPDRGSPRPDQHSPEESAARTRLHEGPPCTQARSPNTKSVRGAPPAQAQSRYVVSVRGAPPAQARSRNVVSVRGAPPAQAQGPNTESVPGAPPAQARSRNVVSVCGARPRSVRGTSHRRRTARAAGAVLVLTSRCEGQTVAVFVHSLWRPQSKTFFAGQAVRALVWTGRGATARGRKLAAARHPIFHILLLICGAIVAPPSRCPAGSSQELRKRLNLEEWILEQLTRLYDCQEEEIPELEIDVDELLDMESDDTLAARVKELLVDCYKPTEAFISGLLDKIRGMQKLSTAQKK
ncbi:PREDICTED: uncharacterized protein LOC102858263 [Elephantulus edwardii]|uniref:uncharacterized protein LOC102858263 n=1 Tax=Elephantulus edwardii TaxID=28737 RepID=UPI0003F0C1D8|nr:PREDICTED: uncharacterized protein LOC102858263 [Elephantulus edwardii]